MELKKIHRELKKEIDNHKSSLEKVIRAFIFDLETEERAIVPQLEKTGEFQELMDKFFKNHSKPLLRGLAEKIRKALLLSVDNFEEDGAKLSDVTYIERSLGIYDGKIQKHKDGKMTVLFAIASLKVIENDILSLLSNAFTGMVTRTDLWKATSKTISRKHYDFFETYAMGSVFQSYNAAQLSFAREYGYNKFLYAGGIIEESRDFCVERAGRIFSRKEGEEWNDMDWKGKIAGVDFFIQAGGHNCLHLIEWTKEDG